MSFRKITLANAAVAAAIIAGGTLLAAAAQAKPGSGGGLKSPAAYKPISLSKGAAFKPIKPFPVKPIGPGVINPGAACKIKGGCGGGPKPTPGAGHGHGKYWALGGITILASQYDGCGYEYYKWKSTGTSYWRAQYEECRGW